jgi:hypothetical protein
MTRPHELHCETATGSEAKENIECRARVLDVNWDRVEAIRRS